VGLGWGHSGSLEWLGQYCSIGYRCYVSVILLFLHVNRFHSIPMMYRKRVFDPQSVSEAWFSRNSYEHTPYTHYMRRF
jgi:hypothetical protein